MIVWCCDELLLKAQFFSIEVLSLFYICVYSMDNVLGYLLSLIWYIVYNMLYIIIDIGIPENNKILQSKRKGIQ